MSSKEEKQHQVYMVGTTHFDPVWMWTWDEAMASIRSTFRSALDRMKEDPNFIYSFSCPPVFEWIKNVDQELFAEIKERVDQGRWDLVEGWWVQPDCSAASGESYVRHGLYGQRYLEENFGQRATTGFNTDSFGHSLMLPQIFKKSGIESYVFGRPSPDEKELPVPLFVWESPDGSSILAFRSGSEGANAYSLDVKRDLTELGQKLKQIGQDAIMLYGVSNHGGAPTKKAIADINEVADISEKDFSVTFSSVKDYFSQQNKEKLPVVEDELIVKFFGTFSNHSEVKRNNRLSEYALLNAEKFAVLANLLTGRDYPGEKLSSLWQDTLFNQFHDILGGASVKPAYFDARNLHGRVLQSADEIMHYSLQTITKDIDTSGEGFPLVVWNPNTFPVDTSVEGELQWAWEFDWYQGPLKITDDRGEVVPAQIIQEYSVLPGFRSRFVFQDTIPALGYKVYHVHQEEQPEIQDSQLQVSEKVLENKRYRLAICQETGSIASIYDKKLDKEIMTEAARPVIKEDEGDTWAFNVDEYGDKLGTFKMESAKIIEDGPIRAVVRTKGTYNNSYLEQDFILYKDAETIEGKFRVNWREQHQVLKLNYNTMLEDPEVTSSIPYGFIKRDNQGREMPTNEWLDISDKERGVSLITDSVFAYDVDGTAAEMTVLRSPVYGHLHRGEKLDKSKEYQYLGQGWREGSWKLVPHDGDWKKVNIPELATAFNNPVITIDEANHEGKLPPENSYIDIKSNSTMVTVLKQAEDNEDLIVRMYEYAGNDDQVEVSLKPLDKRYSVKSNHYEIKSLKLLNECNYNEVEVNNLEEES